MTDKNNRANQLKIEADDLQIKEQVLKDIDKSVRDFFDKNIKLFVTENKEKVKVPVKIATSERWKQMQTEGGLRDNKKQVILPLCLIRRDSVNLKEDRYILPHNRTLTTVIERPTEKDKYTDFSKKEDNSIDNKYIVQIEPPVAVEIPYSIKLQTRYMSSMNSLIEKISMNRNKGRIETDNGFFLNWEISSFDDDSNIEDFSEELRIISNNFDFTVNGTIYTKLKNNKYNVIKKMTPNKISLTEVVD